MPLQHRKYIFCSLLYSKRMAVSTETNRLLAVNCRSPGIATLAVSKTMQPEISWEIPSEASVREPPISMVVSIVPLDRWYIDRWYIITQLARTISGSPTWYIFPANWRIYMVPIPPIKGTRKLHWPIDPSCSPIRWLLQHWNRFPHEQKSTPPRKPNS